MVALALPAVESKPGDEARARLAKLAALGDDWSSYGERPNKGSVELAGDLLDVLTASGWIPSLVAPIAEGGVEFRFASDEKSVRIEVTNELEVVLVTRTSPEAVAEYTDVNAADAAAAVDAFLR